MGFEVVKGTIVVIGVVTVGATGFSVTVSLCWHSGVTFSIVSVNWNLIENVPMIWSFKMFNLHENTWIELFGVVFFSKKFGGKWFSKFSHGFIAFERTFKAVQITLSNLNREDHISKIHLVTYVQKYPTEN